MTIGLSVSRLIAVTATLQAIAAQQQNLSALLILGGTDAIDTTQRLRSYNSMSDVSADFSTTDPEYVAATLWFSQAPQPTQLYIGRYAQTATKGRLNGGILSTAQQGLANFTAITSGGFKIAVDGGALTNVAGLNFSGATTLQGVAGIISAALTGATCTWDAVRGRFVFRSATTGTASAVSLLQAPTSGTDISALIAGTAATGAAAITGIAVETPLQGVTALVNASGDWYALHFAGLTAGPAISVSDLIATSGFLEAQNPPRTHLYTSADTTSLDPTVTSDVFSQMKALGYNHTFGQYSSSSPYAAVSAGARILTTNFTGNNTVITLMYKQEPGVAAETLTASQATALQGKNANVFVNYQNNTAIIQFGTMASGLYFDEQYGADYAVTAIQTALFNRLYTSTTKVPQTDAGNQDLGNVIEGVCATLVTDGLVAPGTWTSDGFGQLVAGQFMAKGYYIYIPPIATQSQADRASRKSVPMQVALKLAGAIHTVNVALTFNR